jgi:hypothetical protein
MLQCSEAMSVGSGGDVSGERSDQALPVREEVRM